MPSPLGGETGFVGQSTSERNAEGQAEGLQEVQNLKFEFFGGKDTLDQSCP